MPTTTTADTPTTGTAELLLAELATHPESTVTDLAAALGASRSTVTRALVGLEADGRATRTVGARSGGRREPDRWSSLEVVPSSERLGRGGLRDLVLDWLRANPGEHGAVAVAKGLGGRSSGAVTNGLVRLVEQGLVEQTAASPRRFRATA